MASILRIGFAPAATHGAGMGTLRSGHACVRSQCVRHRHAKRKGPGHARAFVSQAPAMSGHAHGDIVALRLTPVNAE
jgi:hypothetical protein